MLPLDLPGRPFALPPGERYSAVVFTGSAELARHVWMMRRLESRFPGLVKRWYVSAPSEASVSAGPATRLPGVFSRIRRRLSGSSNETAFGDAAAAERELFSAESEMPPSIPLPTVVSNSEPSDLAAYTSAEVPYFVISFDAEPRLGVPGMTGSLVLDLVAGWAPDYVGDHAIEWALFDRRFDRLGSTVRRMHRDSPPTILRRSGITVTDDASPAECVARAAALAVELMLEVVGAALTASALVECGDSLASMDTTRSPFGQDERAVIAAQFGRGWLGDAARERRHY